MQAVKDLLKSEGISLSNSKAENGLLGQDQTVQILDLNPKNSSLKQQSLGSLAWWGTALVRRRSRDQSPPEAPLEKSSLSSELFIV